ncbi:MAG: hypothetical protein ACLPIG_14330 [Methylocella sp.]
MDWLTFISTVINSIAWPTVAVIALVVLRSDIAALLGKLGSRLQTAKGAGVELTFAQGVDDIEDKLPPAETKAITEVKDTKQLEDFTELARLPPPYIVSQAWLRLEHAIQSAVDASLVNKPAPAGGRRLSPVAYLNLVTVQRILPEEDFGVLHELRILRNRAAHSLDPDITVTDALRYNDIVNSLIRKIEQPRRQHSSDNDPS